ncbi:hypothetical protein K7X08_017540 [Anisodus acutangulus]|uniref:Uncharacterized protein n=1 Tax=Anisodus acutangulus TaxID=402998 RepID=A0A9Q1LXJ8_9SOLA|nr:hypothetical protein K7X08_017540 [Anisodus acutangulus]
MASSTVNRWLRPEVYPLFGAVGVAVGICGFQLVRNICINPEVRVTKENRGAGVLENFSEGEKYAEHALRKFVRNRPYYPCLRPCSPSSQSQNLDHNRPFFSDSLSDTNVNIIDIPFPQNIEGIPPGDESTDRLPSMSLFVPFAKATKLMKPDFELTLESLSPVTFMITDSFLPWTLDSANKFGISRFAYYGLTTFSLSLMSSSGDLLRTELSDDEMFTLPNFPWIKLTRNDFDPPFKEREPKGPLFDFAMEETTATSKSYDLIVSSFYELESVYVDYLIANVVLEHGALDPFVQRLSHHKNHYRKG